MKHTRHGNREIYKVMSPENYQSSNNIEEPGIKREISLVIVDETFVSIEFQELKNDVLELSGIVASQNLEDALQQLTNTHNVWSENFNEIAIKLSSEVRREKKFNESIKKMIDDRIPMANVLNAIKKEHDGKLPIIPTYVALTRILKMPLNQVREIEFWDRNKNEPGLINDQELNTFFEPWINNYFSGAIQQEHKILETENL
jgi:hypothetical protein